MMIVNYNVYPTPFLQKNTVQTDSVITKEGVLNNTIILKPGQQHGKYVHLTMKMHGQGYYRITVLNLPVCEIRQKMPSSGKQFLEMTEL